MQNKCINMQSIDKWASRADISMAAVTQLRTDSG